MRQTLDSDFQNFGRLLLNSATNRIMNVKSTITQT